jgi:hypothetical protein
MTIFLPEQVDNIDFGEERQLENVVMGVVAHTPEEGHERMQPYLAALPEQSDEQRAMFRRIADKANGRWKPPYWSQDGYTW